MCVGWFGSRGAVLSYAVTIELSDRLVRAARGVEIKVGSMGESALTGHAKGKKHIQQCPVEGGGIKSITAAT